MASSPATSYVKPARGPQCRLEREHRHAQRNSRLAHRGPNACADRPMVIRHHGLAGTTTYRSFHAAAMWTFCEGERTLRRVRYRKPLEGVFLGSGTGQKCVSSLMAGDRESLPANRRKTKAPPQAIETRRCDGCDADLRPAPPWSRFCCPACRLRAHRKLAGRNRSLLASDASRRLAGSRSSQPAHCTGLGTHNAPASSYSAREGGSSASRLVTPPRSGTTTSFRLCTPRNFRLR